MKNVLVIVFVALSALLSACGENYSNGSRVGTVNKFSYKGLVMKSWEGEMNMGGFRNQTDSNGNTAVVANVFRFNVQSPEVVKKVQDAMTTGARVELVYRQWALSPMSQESDYTVIDVKPAK